MNRHYITVFFTSLLAYLAVCWTNGIQHCDAAWAQSVLYFTITLLYIRRYGHALSIVLCVIGGRLTPEIILDGATLLAGGSAKDILLPFDDLAAAVAAITAAIYHRYQRGYVLAGITGMAVVLNVLAQPLWTELVNYIKAI